MSTPCAFLFPGQGSQSEGMLGDVARAHKVIEATFLEASLRLGYDLWQITQHDPDQQLNQTHITQPALLAAGVAVYRALSNKGPFDIPMMAGHSLGEYSALVCAGVLDFQDAVDCVQLRGQAMQAAVSEGLGAMAAIIGLEDEVVTKLCEQMAQGEVLSPANFNSVGQVVVAGHASAVDRLMSAAADAGAKLTTYLPVSVPSHCELMRPAMGSLSAKLTSTRFHPPKVPVLQNATLEIHEHVDDIREALVQQLVSPVPWVNTIERLKAEGVLQALEVGPGRVLTGLNKRIDRTFKTTPGTSLLTQGESHAHQLRE